jgi:hypothetical protein
MQADLVGAVFIRAGECTAAHTAITALRRLQRLCGEPVLSVAKSIFVALYVLKRGEASPS